MSNYNEQAFERKVVFTEYKAKSGDTVTTVAQRFSTQPEPIRELNGLGPKANTLRVGANLVLPVPTGHKRVIASLYDEKPVPKRRRYRRRKARSYRSSITAPGRASGVRKRQPTSVGSS